MTETYRVRYKNGELEIEIESTEKEYVDKKLDELLSLTSIPQVSLRPKTETLKKPSPKKQKENALDENETEVDIAGLVGFIKDSDKFPQVEEKVLKKREQLPRIMMVLYFVKDYAESPYFTTGQIQVVTNQLGVRIKSQNSANVIKGNQKYFTAQAVRKPGAVVPYKLNYQGIQAFEKYLDGEKL